MKTAATISQMPGRAKRASMPRVVEVMKATLVDKPFSKAGWIFETKWDGERAIAFFTKGKLRLESRNHKEITRSYPELQKLLTSIKAESAILDGEIVMMDKLGKPNFGLLQSRFGLTSTKKLGLLSKDQRVVYNVFDILYLNGYDLTSLSLLERKKLLKRTIRNSNVLKYTPHVVRDGLSFFATVKRAHGEGMIAKDAASTYEHRRSTSWLKVKTSMRQEVVIAGYTLPHGARAWFGALQLGLFMQGKFVSIGQVGTGFSHATLEDLYKRMQPLKIKHHPFEVAPEEIKEIQWIKPKLVCEVQFSQWTKDRKLRHPSFEGLREDKEPKECILEHARHTSNQVP